MLSRTTEYALRAVVLLAEKYAVPQTTQQIANATQVPVDYLAKVMQALGRGRVVRAHRGLHGGFTLTRDPSQVTALDVINAVDPIRRIHQCPLRLDAHVAGLCPLHRRLDDAIATIEAAFAKTTLAELLADSSGVRPLCSISAALVGIGA